MKHYKDHNFPFPKVYEKILMTGLNINIHNSQEMSIMDLSHDLDISDIKWDLLINHFSENSEAAYFYGFRLNYFDTEVKKDIEFLSENGLFNEDEKFNRILFRIKPASLILNRNLLSRLWKAYEAPSLIFSEKNNSQASIKNILFEQIYYSKLFQSINGISVLYKGIENNVLWIISTDKISNISELYF